MSKQAYHKQKGVSAARKAAKEAFALEYIRSVRSEDPGIGGKKLWFMYKRDFPDGDRVGRDWFEDIVYRHHLKVRNKMRKPKTTDSRHGLPLYPNLAYDLIPSGINQLWVSDITYIPVWLDGESYTFCYLSMVSDAYSHEIIGWAVGASLESKYTVRALDMALERLKKDGGDTAAGGLIHHSDRGIQYASRGYTEALESHNVCISMTEDGNPKDNAIAERANSTVKNELLKGMRFTCITEVEDAIAKAVWFYNTKRPHMSIDMMTPQQAALCNGEIRKWWTSYREKAIKSNESIDNPEKKFTFASL